jgi:4-hydroxy-2-oxoheptanedioate aldolase
MAGRESSLRERLRERRLVGTFVKLPALESIEICAAELDFAVVDLEHSQLAEGDALRLVRHANVLGFPAVVRIPEVDRGLVNRLLEAGAVGIQLSSVRRRTDVEELSSAMLYAPDGTRSLSLAHPRAGFGSTPLADYLAAQVRPLLVAQLETATTDDSPEEILSVGVDVAFIGTTDLTVDLELDSQRVAARVDELVAAAERAGVFLGGFGLEHDALRYEVRSADVALLRKAVAGVR